MTDPVPSFAQRALTSAVQGLRAWLNQAPSAPTVSEDPALWRFLRTMVALNLSHMTAMARRESPYSLSLATFHRQDGMASYMGTRPSGWGVWEQAVLAAYGETLTAMRSTDERFSMVSAKLMVSLTDRLGEQDFPLSTLTIFVEGDRAAALAANRFEAQAHRLNDAWPVRAAELGQPGRL